MRRYDYDGKHLRYMKLPDGGGVNGTGPHLLEWLEDRDLLGVRVANAFAWEAEGYGALFDESYRQYMEAHA